LKAKDCAPCKIADATRLYTAKTERAAIMKITAAVLCLAGSAAAFAPVSQNVSSHYYRKMSFET
jgi:hypothetical protein